MFDNITSVQWVLYSISLSIAFLLGLGIRALWDIVTDKLQLKEIWKLLKGTF